MRKKVDTVLNILKTNPRLLWPAAGMNRLLDWMPDSWYLKLVYKARTGRKLNLKNPEGYCEKLQWIKLYDRQAKYSTMVDKYEVRSFIAEKIGEEYLIPLLGVWKDAESLSLSSLPEQFVLKCTHDSGSVCICMDKNSFDFESAKKKLAGKLATSTYWGFREWPYKNVKPRIIAEKYMVDESGDDLRDYKVMCFAGEPKLIELHRGRYLGTHTQDFYDTNWNRLNITQAGTPMAKDTIPAPENLDKMLELSAILSKDIPHLRVDWYSINGKLYFGELTFFDSSGFDLFDDPAVEKEIGSWIPVPF